MGQGVAEFDYTQELANIFHRESKGIALSFFHHSAGHLAAHVADFALRVAHARFTGERADDLRNGLVSEFELVFRKARGFALLAHQELLGNLNLLELSVSVQPQYLHAVL